MIASWRVLTGDALEQLRELDEGTVQCCVTSPPYYGLRDYGTAEWEGGDPACDHHASEFLAACGKCGARRKDQQIGLEASVEAFLGRLVVIFREVRRVLRDDGTLWLNMGDSYNSGTNAVRKPSAASDHGYWQNGGSMGDQRINVASCKPKDLLGIPWLLALALRDDGWYLRSDIIWSKPNPMPESVTDRPTSAHEHLFLLSKSPRYYYDADAIRERYAPGSEERIAAGFKDRYSEVAAGGFRGAYGGPAGEQVNPAGRNKRNVWEIATSPYPEAHFATFPPKLVEPCVLAGSSPQACHECGAPWQRVTEVAYENPGNRTTNGPRSVDRRHLEHGSAGFAQRLERRSQTLGWAPTCEHHDSRGRCVILDPFAGAGTTGMVALRHDRAFVGIELNGEYADMARQRIRDDAPLMNVVSEVA